jgi:hypothetical protein
MNSMRAVERAIAFEIERQADVIDGGGAIHMETRGWDEGRQSTYHMRPKEEENDYRYFPEPDLPPLLTSPEWLAEIKARLPELPAARREVATAQTYSGSPRTTPGCSSTTLTATALFEGALAAGPGALPAEAPRQLGDRRVHAPGQRRGGEWRLGRGSGRAGRAGQAGRRRGDLRHERQGSPRPAFRLGRGRVASIVEARGFRQISDVGVIGDRQSMPSWRPTLLRWRITESGKDRGGRLPRRSGHESHPRPGQRRHGSSRAARAAGQARVGEVEREWARST